MLSGIPSQPGGPQDAGGTVGRRAGCADRDTWTYVGFCQASSSCCQEWQSRSPAWGTTDPQGQQVVGRTGCQFISSCCLWCFHFDTLEDHFGTSGTPWETILAPRDHPGGPWKHADGHEVVRNRFCMILKRFWDLILRVDWTPRREISIFVRVFFHVIFYRFQGRSFDAWGSKFKVFAWKVLKIIFPQTLISMSNLVDFWKPWDIFPGFSVPRKQAIAVVAAQGWQLRVPSLREYAQGRGPQPFPGGSRKHLIASLQQSRSFYNMELQAYKAYKGFWAANQEVTRATGCRFICCKTLLHSLVAHKGPAGLNGIRQLPRLSSRCNHDTTDH